MQKKITSLAVRLLCVLMFAISHSQPVNWQKIARVIGLTGITHNLLKIKKQNKLNRFGAYFEMHPK